MSTNLQSSMGTFFVEAEPARILIRSEQDAVDLVGICGGYGTHKLLLYADNLADDFFDLKTRLAGLAGGA